MIARDDFGEEEMRLFLHSTNFRRMRKAASATQHCPVISMVGPTGAGKSACNIAPLPLARLMFACRCTCSHRIGWQFRTGKSSIIKRLNPLKPPVVAFQEQQIPTTSNVNSFMSHGWNGLGPVRILDLEGDDGGLPLMEYWSAKKSRFVVPFAIVP